MLNKEHVVNKRTIIILFVVVVAGLCALHIAFVSRPNQKALNMLGEASSIIEKAKSLTSYTEILAQYEQACVLIDSVLREYPKTSAVRNLRNGEVLIGGYSYYSFNELWRTISQRAEAENDLLTCITLLATHKDMQGRREHILEQCAKMYLQRGEQEKARAIVRNIESENQLKRKKRMLQEYLDKKLYDDAVELVINSFGLIHPSDVFESFPEPQCKRLIKQFLDSSKRGKVSKIRLDKVSEYCEKHRYIDLLQRAEGLYTNMVYKARLYIRFAEMWLKEGNQELVELNIQKVNKIIESVEINIQDEILDALSRYYYELSQDDKAMECIDRKSDDYARISALFRFCYHCIWNDRRGDAYKIINMCQTLLDKKDDSPQKNAMYGEIIQQYCEMGDFVKAEEVFAQHKDKILGDLTERNCELAVEDMAKMLVKNGRQEEALPLFLKLRKLNSRGKRDSLLTEIVKAYARAGDINTVRQVLVDNDSEYALEAVFAFMNAGHEDCALLIAGEPQHESVAKNAYSFIAYMCIVSGHEELADKIVLERQKDDSLLSNIFYWAWKQSDDFDEDAAKAILMTIAEYGLKKIALVVDEDVKTDLIADICSVYSSLGMAAEALSLAESVKDKNDFASILIQIADSHSSKGDHESARKLYERALSVSYEIPDPKQAALSVISCASKLSDSEKGLHGLEMLRRVTYESFKGTDHYSQADLAYCLRYHAVEMKQWEIVIDLLLECSLLDEDGRWFRGFEPFIEFVFNSVKALPDYQPTTTVQRKMRSLLLKHIPTSTLWHPKTLETERDISTQRDENEFIISSIMDINASIKDILTSKDRSML